MGRIDWRGGTAETGDAGPLAVHIGKQILKVRQRRQLTMREVAESCGLSLSFFCDMENGKKMPGALTLWKLSKTLGHHVDYWFKGYED